MKAALALIPLLALAACGGPADEPGNGAVQNVPTTQEYVPASEAGPLGNAAGPTLEGLGEVAIGDTVEDLRARELSVTRDEPLPGSTCGYAKVATLPDTALMLDGQTVVRIDVQSGTQPTLGGVTIGMTEAEALKRLGKTAVVQPNHYTGPEGHDILVHEEGAPLGLILTTDGGKVANYRFGRWEQVQWIEGCA